MNIELRGENKRFFYSKSNRKLLVGAPSVGKALTAMYYMHSICVQNDNYKCLLIGESLPSLRNSAVKTLEYVLELDNFKNKIKILGGNRPIKFIYPNGSTISLLSTDDFSKLLGDQYNLAYVHEPTIARLTLDEFKLICSHMRLGSSNLQPIIIVDGNLPFEEGGKREHWLYSLPDYGFEVFNPTHKDNPMLFNWTDLGKEMLNQLNKLSEYYKKILLEGKWKIS